ncbi:DUF998 domain-containing protein [Vulcanisaeta souniana]|uniref:Membrane protein n=1 Tax=Vulcanisaeta souniana JCM 11219 TaxID=1293586 RepID=A0A830E4D4_9CREN|nr:DUF998 domain-containing protein [Vulcanisaeta souniana]BDR91916.1 membrane protein [Vulcanisaeta souniana JCM 11219]GGI69389.1 membrane protein [Vulcanisaeta souniana JCM 11219]
MTTNRLSTAGLLIFIGVAEFLLLMLTAEALYPGYSVSRNYISDLGVGPTAVIFNSSIIIMGLLLIIAAILTWKLSKVFAVTIALTGIGAMGVGIFPETVHPFHLIFALIAFLFASISSYPTIKISRSPGRVLWPILGTIGLIALILYIMHMYLGLGPGGMERMIVYPNLTWALAFSAELMNYKDASGV